MWASTAADLLIGLAYRLTGHLPAAVMAATSGEAAADGGLVLNCRSVTGELLLLVGHLPTTAPPLRELWLVGSLGMARHRGVEGDWLWQGDRATPLAPAGDLIAREAGAWLAPPSDGATPLMTLDEFAAIRAAVDAARASLPLGQPAAVAAGGNA
jgi:hypothetical protein